MLLFTGDKNISLLFTRLRMIKSGLLIRHWDLIKYTREEFVRNWTSTLTDGKPAGLVLIIEPTPALFKNENEREKDKWFQIPV